MAEKKSEIKKALLWAVMALAIGLAYQNCAPAGVEDTELESQSQVDETPFAFDLKLDTISHMSCTQNNDATYTFKAGAYFDGNGIGLRQEFLDYVGSNDKQRILDAILNSEWNVNAQPQMAVRNSTGTNPFLTLWAVGSENTYEIMGPLGSEEYAAPIALTESTRKIRHFRTVPSIFERNVGFRMKSMGNLGGFQAIRTELESGKLLTASFTDYQQPNSAPIAPTAEEAGFKAFGNGYQLGFQAAPNAPASHRRFLTAITTRDLMDQADLGDNWVCIHYKMVRYSDWEATPSLCPISADPAPTAQRNSIHETVRRIVDPMAKHWYIHTRVPTVGSLNVENCMVSKQPVDSCYSTGAQTIIYGAQACDDTDTDTNNNCAHYTSVCWLNN